MLLIPLKKSTTIYGMDISHRPIPFTKMAQQSHTQMVLSKTAHTITSRYLFSKSFTFCIHIPMVVPYVHLSISVQINTYPKNLHIFAIAPEIWRGAICGAMWSEHVRYFSNDMNKTTTNFHFSVKWDSSKWTFNAGNTQPSRCKGLI